MASFRKRNNLWQAQVRNKHVGSISKSFHIKSEAQRWAKEQEVLMQSGQWSRVNKSSLTLHDLRHESISRMFEKGLNIPEVASISGHKTATQLFRCVQVKARL